jgi:hypothetical protein
VAGPDPTVEIWKTCWPPGCAASRRRPAVTASGSLRKTWGQPLQLAGRLPSSTLGFYSIAASGGKSRRVLPSRLRIRTLFSLCSNKCIARALACAVGLAGTQAFSGTGETVGARLGLAAPAGGARCSCVKGNRWQAGETWVVGQGG